MVQRPRAVFTGVTTYRDPEGRFFFRYPSDWHQSDPAGDQEGVVFSPYPDTRNTWFSALVTRLQDTVVAEDADLLRAGVDEGLRRMDGLEVEHETEVVLGNLIKFERTYTFAEDGAIRKRKVWIMYVANWLVVVAYQGESPEEYRHWLAMANYSFSTFDLPGALWFASDRTLGGHNTREELAQVTQPEEPSDEHKGESGRSAKS